MNTRRKILYGSDRSYFNRFDVYNSDFQEKCDCIINIKNLNGICFINTGSGDIEYSFNGNTLHGKVITGRSVSFTNKTINKIWFRVPDGVSSVSVSAGSGGSFSIGRSFSSGGSADTTRPLPGIPFVVSDGWRIRIPFNESLNTLSCPAADRFNLTDTLINVIDTEIGSNYIDLFTSAVIAQGETVAVTYIPGDNPIQDLAENNADGFSDVECDNDSEIAIFRPYGYGINLCGDWIAGSNFYDFGIGGIARWHDQSSFGRHATQTDIARQPGIEILDDKECVRFDKDNTEWLAVDAVASLLSGNNVPFVFEWYGQAATNTTNGVLFSAGRSIAGGGVVNLHYPSSSGTTWRALRANDSGTSNNRTATPNLSGSQRFFRLTFDGTNLIGTVASTPGVTTTMVWNNAAWNVGTTTMDIATFGCNRNQSNPTGALFGGYRVIRCSLWSGGILPGVVELNAWEIGASS